MLYASAALIIVQDIDTAAQRFLMGHTADVVALSAAEDTLLVASAQEGPLPIIRLWDRDTCMPLAILQQHASDMHTLSLSHDGALLAAVGKDRKGHQLLAVWDVTQAGAQVPSCPLLDAKVTLSHIKAIQWVPPDPLDAITKAANGDASNEAMQLITCGYENVRFGGCARQAPLVRHRSTARGGVPLPVDRPRRSQARRRRARAAEAAPHARRRLDRPSLRHRPHHA